MSETTTVPHSVKLLGLVANTTVPATAEQYDKLAGAGECVSKAVQSDMYRGWAGTVRATFCKLAAAATGIARRVTGTKQTGEGDKVKEVNVYETEQSYLNFLIASGKTPAELQPLMDEAAATLPFCDWLVEEPSAAGSAGGGRISKGDLETATKILARWESGAVNERTGVAFTPASFLAGLESRLTDPTLPESPTVEDVARLVAQFRKAQDIANEIG